MTVTTLRAASFAAVMLAAAVAAASSTIITSEPDGKRVLFVDDKGVDDLDHHTVIHIQGNDLLANIHDPAVLVVDDNNVRHSPAGVKLATFDGNDIRHGDRGKVMINYTHPDLCPDSASNRIFRVDGPELTHQQLVAVLYILKPDMFKLSDAETKEQQKAIAEAGAESDRLAAMDQVEGKWTVLSGSGPVEKISKGRIAFDKKRSDIYPTTFDFGPGGGPAYGGVSTYSDAGGDKVFWTAFGTAEKVGLCVYEIDGANLKGTWSPWYADGDAKNLGTETLKGSAGSAAAFGGNYDIVSAKAPTSGAAYSGKVAITPLEITGASNDEKPYTVVWTLGDVKVYGIGIKTGNKFYVASGAGPDLAIGKFKIDNGSFNGDFFKFGAKEMGSMAAMKDN